MTKNFLYILLYLEKIKKKNKKNWIQKGYKNLILKSDVLWGFEKDHQSAKKSESTVWILNSEPLVKLSSPDANFGLQREVYANPAFYLTVVLFYRVGLLYFFFLQRKKIIFLKYYLSLSHINEKLEWVMGRIPIFTKMCNFREK